MEELLRQLNIQGELKRTPDNSYVIDLEDSDEYGKVYSELDKSDLVEEEEDSSQLTVDTSSIQFTNEEYTLTLLADFNEDTYQLVIREN